MTQPVLNTNGLAAVAEIIRESSDLSVAEALTAAAAILNAYFLAAGSGPTGPQGEGK